MDKYTKCYSCKEVNEVYKTLVKVSDNCPKKIKLNNGFVVSKKICEKCEYYTSMQNV